MPFNRLRSCFGIKIEKKIPRIIIHEKYEKTVKYLNRFLIIFGIVSSVISFPTWYSSLSFAIILFWIGWTIEKTIFRFTSMFITPMPNFTYNPNEWNGMGYMFVQSNLKALSFFGPSFKTEEYGINLFGLLSEWNFNQLEDTEKNICISFIEEKDDNYSVYLYPNRERKSIKKFREKINSLDKYKDKDHQELIVQMTLCKRFPLMQNSNYHIWKSLFLKGQPACLGAFLYNETNGKINPINKIKPIKINDVKFKKRAELKKDELEYQHGKFIMGV